MKTVLRLFASLALLLSATTAFARGDKKHGEEETHPAASEAAHARPGHVMIVAADEVISNAKPADHDDEQVESEGMNGVLKSLHPATVHFPIALFLMAALTEFFVMSRRTSEREAAVRIMIFGGAMGGELAHGFNHLKL